MHAHSTPDEVQLRFYLHSQESYSMEFPEQQRGVAKRAMTTGRRKRAACERCNRRRTKCDGWLIGVPCSGCKKSNNHKQCALMQSKRRRCGPLEHVHSRYFPSFSNFCPGARMDDTPLRLMARRLHARRSPIWRALYPRQQADRFLHRIPGLMRTVAIVLPARPIQVQAAGTNSPNMECHSGSTHSTDKPGKGLV